MMGINAARERRKAEKKQHRLLVERDQTFANGSIAHNRIPATSNGVRQVTSLAKLPTLAKTITVREGEIQLYWHLKCEDVRALQMILLIYEANGWKVNRG